jgi:hypothetical protein
MKPTFLPFKKSSVGTVALLAIAFNSAYADDQYSEEASKMIGDFSTQLKTALQSSMQSGGPVAAIETCNLQAPAIAAHLNQEGTWQIARTSLRPRNPDNTPDTWEKSVLERFENLKENGTSMAELKYSEVVELDGQSTFRFMQAIPTGALCLKCHGDAIAPDVKEKVDSLYPADQAVGFKEGDIRGAFSLMKTL